MGTVAVLALAACGGDGTQLTAPTLEDCATVSQGQAIEGTGSAEGTHVTLVLRQSIGGWKTIPVVSDVTGGTLQHVALDDGDGQDVIIQITLTNGSLSGTFALSGTMVGYENGTPACDVARAFSFTIGGPGGAVTVK